MTRRTRIKICGIRDLATALAAVEAGADAIGLVFVPRSPRFVQVEDAKRIVQALPAFIEPVGLFVDATPQQVLRTASEVGLRTVQLHGKETPAQAAEMMPLRVIKSLPFDPRSISTQLAPWRSAPANFAGLLLDTPPATNAALTGGSGHAFSWSDLSALEHAGVLAGLPPLILAGGLTPENVADAVRQLRPYAVDVSSGVESSRGVKDSGLIRAFCQAVRQAESAA